MANTNYDINVRYQLTDLATPKAKKLGTALSKTSRHAIGLKSALGKLAVVAGTGFGLALGKKYLVDYNAGLQTSKLTMAGLIKLNLGGSWASGQKRANALIEQFKKDAVHSAGTLKDFANFGELIIGPVTRAGLSMADLRDITKGGVVAAKAFGYEADVAARDIESALGGTLGKKDRFARALLEPMGLTTQAWNKMVSETPQKAAKTLVSAFNQPALEAMANEYSNTWAGVTSTLEDNLQQTLGKIGLPLMKQLTKEVGNLNIYFAKNQDSIKRTIKSFSSGLMKGFSVVKDVIKFIANNSSMLLSVAKAFVGFKVIRGMGSLAAAPLDFLSAWASKTNTSTKAVTTFSGRLTKAANGLASFGTAMAMAYTGASLLADYIDRKQDETQKSRLKSSTLVHTKDQLSMSEVLSIGKAASGDTSGIDSSAARKAQMMAMVAREEGFLSKGKTVMSASQKSALGASAGLDAYTDPLGFRLDSLVQSIELAAAASKNLSIANKEAAMQAFAASDSSKALKEGVLGVYDSLVNVLMGKGLPASDEEKKITKSTRKNGNVKVYINQIKVVSPNPDQFAVNIVGAFKNATKRPVSSRMPIPGGIPG